MATRNDARDFAHYWHFHTMELNTLVNYLGGDVNWKQVRNLI